MRTVKIAYTPPQRRSLGEKLRYKLAVRRKGARPIEAAIYRTTSQTAAIFTGRWAVSGKTPPLCCWKLTPVRWPGPNPLCGCWSTTNLPFPPCRRNIWRWCKHPPFAVENRQEQQNIDSGTGKCYNKNKRGRNGADL